MRVILMAFLSVRIRWYVQHFITSLSKGLKAKDSFDHFIARFILLYLFSFLIYFVLQNFLVCANQRLEFFLELVLHSAQAAWPRSFVLSEPIYMIQNKFSSWNFALFQNEKPDGSYKVQIGSFIHITAIFIKRFRMHRPFSCNLMCTQFKINR